MAHPTDETMHVVLATDDSEPAHVAEDWVRRLHFSQEPTIDIVCVAGPGMTRFGWGLQTYREPVRQALEGIRQRELYAAERISNEVGERLQRAGRTVRTWARQGDCVEELLALAEVEQPHLIVLGSRGRSALAAAILGSVTQAISARATTAVLVARPPRSEQGPLPQHVLLVVDGSPSSANVAAWLHRSGWAREAPVTVLGLLGQRAGLEDEHRAAIEDIGQLLRADALAQLHRVAEPLDEHGNVTFELRSGHPFEAILQLGAELGDVDLVAVHRPRPHGGSEFAEKLVQHATTSVLLVPAD